MIGLSCRSAGARNQAELWQLIRNGENHIREVCRESWLEYFKAHTGRSSRFYYGAMADPLHFDPLFFHISPKEAEAMDISQRILLEACYTALEDAGIAPQSLQGQPVGTFIGAGGGFFATTDNFSHLAMLGSDASIQTSRIAYFLDLKGPALAINTACSSSLVAVHTACTALKSGEIDLSVAGGITIWDRPKPFLSMSNAGMLSPSGLCSPFDNRADGIVMGDGVGIVILKRLRDAEQDHDPIYGIIRGSGTNQDGQTSGITVPSALAQSQLQTAIYQKAGISIQDLQYIETHGTATKLGDPMEIQALNQTFDQTFGQFAQTGGPRPSCAIGSLKANIGHTSAAAGVLGLIKVLLCLKHRQLPPLTNFNTPNEHIDFDKSCLYVNTALKEWPQNASGTRLAAVSSFGYSGTNAHLVVEQAMQPPSFETNEPSLIVLSAKDPERLREYAAGLLDFIAHPPASLASLAYTLQTGRDAMQERLAVTAGSFPELAQKLQQYLDGHNNQEKTNELAARWLGGEDIDWQQFYPHTRPFRISLPTYPFARESYRTTTRFMPVEDGDDDATMEKAVTPAAPDGGPEMEQRVLDDLATLISGLLKLPKARLRASSNFADLGFDSILLTEFAQTLSQRYELDITADLFFDHPTLKQLADYFLAEHGSTIHRLHKAPAPTLEPGPEPEPPPRPVHRPERAANAKGEIAIIGMSGRFPKARNIEEMWQILANGQTAVEKIQASRFNWREYDPKSHGKINGKWCGSLPGAREFDPLFFEISPGEAQTMDPRQRLLLQESWNALEDAGYGPGHLAGQRTGMYVGVEEGDYRQLVTSGRITANNDAILASRLAYFLDLDGPVMAINTACSSSLVAAHQACASLRNHECDTALAAGVHLMCTPEGFAGMSRAGMISPDGVAYVFDQRANGMVPGEAVAVVVLKRLEDAIAQGDPIHTVIRASGVNYDGKTNGITAPSGASQARLITDIYQRHGIDPADISYIIAHGTGTPLGDPMEVNALVKAFDELTPRDQKPAPGSCALTSNKTNFGHTAGASGLVSLINMVQALRHKTIPPSLHCQEENKSIRWRESGFYVNKTPSPWPGVPGRERMGAVSAFGMSGTNAHMVLESYASPHTPAAPSGRDRLLVLSAKTAQALQERIEGFIDFLATQSSLGLDAVSYTLLAGRHHFQHRCALVAGNADEALSILNQKDIKKSANLFKAEVPRNFTGQTAVQRVTGQLTDLPALAELFCQGYDIPWQKLFSDPAPMRLHLPTYPFGRDPYWVTDTPATPAPDLSGIFCFEETWQQAPPLSPTRQIRQIRTLLCLLSEPENQAALAAEMKVLSPSTNIFFLSRTAENHEHELQHLKQKADVDALLYLWPLEDHGLVRDLSPLVTFFHAMDAARLQPGSIWLAGPWKDGLDRCYVDAWIGFERTLKRILTQTPVRVFSKEVAPRHDAVKEWITALWPEIVSKEPQSVCLEHGKRLICQIRPVVMPDAPRTMIKAGGTYLITGGCGGLGLLFARYLADTYGARLILTGRSALTPEKEQVIASLSAGNGSAVYLQSDICNAREMKQGLAGLKLTGPINGIIHAAGISEPQSMFEKSATDFQRVLDPKIQGTLVLDEILGEPVDFVCYFSSSSAVLGDFGACDYAVGNRFQMAYARYQNGLQQPGKTIAVTWPLWRDGGMTGNDHEKTGFYLKTSGQRFLEAGEGMALFEGVLNADKSLLLPLKGDKGRIHGFLGLDQEQKAQDTQGGEPLETRVYDDLRAQMSRLLKIPADHFEKEENLAEFGFDSLGLSDFAEMLSGHFGFTIKPSLFYGYTTLEQLTQYFLKEHGSAMQRFYNTEKPDIPKSVPNQRRVETTQHQPREKDIAIIGMSGRFPKADTVAQFWEHIKTGQNCIGPVPQDRRGLWPPETDPKIRGGFINGIDRFDPVFFSIPPNEANTMDPRQRLFLEEAWHAFEDAGYMGDRIRGASCGVYVGVEEGDYGLDSGKASITSNQNATLAARIAYALDLRGPNLALTASCSSSLVALHQACLALRQSDCHMALAAGVNLLISPKGFAGLKEFGMLSPTGQCRVFDRAANGLVPAEAVAVVILKPLSRAIADNDRIHGVIKAVGVNYDGKTNGITAPSPLSQARLLKDVYAANEIDPAAIQYVLAHSVGSPLGDPLEFEALIEAFRESPFPNPGCALGSIKPLIGHTFAASGLVSLIAMLMALKDKTIPALPGFQHPNPQIDLSASPFILSSENRAWNTKDGMPRMGAVSSTGISGTNAHAVIAEHLPEHQDRAIGENGPSKQHLAVFSAKTPGALDQVVTRMIEFLEENPHSVIADICYTLQVGRDAMKARLALVVNSTNNLVSQLKAPHRSSQPLSGSPEADLAAQWLAEKKIDWQVLHPGPKPNIITLPGYPFDKKRCWLDTHKAPAAPGPSPQKAREDDAGGNKVAELYNFLARDNSEEFREEYITFFPFEKRIPGFSITRIASAPDQYPEEIAIMKKAQRQLRQVLFCKEDFTGVHNFLDFGCGYGTDVIQIAATYDHIETTGYTITPAQAKLGNKRIEHMNLVPRAKIFNRDSSKDPFPGTYDLVLGVEVACHIKDKDGLLENITTHLREGGRILLMEFIANLRGEIIDHGVSVYIPTVEGWAALLARHGLVIDEIIDVSPQIANSMHDPDYKKNTAGLPEVVRNSWQNWANNAVAIDKGWVSYSLFKVQRQQALDEAELMARNLEQLANQIPYARAVELMHQYGHIPYPKPNSAPLCHPGQQPAAGAKAELIRILSGILGYEAREFETLETFDELGITSLNAVEILESINTRFNLKLPTSVLFDHHSLDGLSAYIQPLIKEEPAKPVNLPKGTTAPKNRPAADHDIAIIGLSCRCAGANNKDELWDLVRNGRDCLKEISDPEWLAFFQENGLTGKPPRLGIMAGHYLFDPLFFRISPKEARFMDPCQRILLEEGYNALVDAGCDTGLLKDCSVGTYIGTSGGGQLFSRDLSHLSMLGADTSILAARLAFYLDIKGPALAVNTACSSSLVALDLACKALQSGDIDMAIAGGITVWDHPAPFVSMSRSGMLSPSGQCRPFDDLADGIVVGDGAGLVIAKRLADAIRDRDPIYGVIRAIGTNQDGQTSGITVPSFSAQSRLQSRLYRQYKIPVADLAYLETHGTATRLGDPVEIHALGDSFSQFTPEKGFCAIGSLKANIGHTSAAAGILSVIKVLLCLQHRKLPPAINFDTGNTHIDFPDSPVYVNTRLKEWPVDSQGTRLAAVSSFGYSGTNAHLVLEQPKANASIPHPGPSNPFTRISMPRPAIATPKPANGRTVLTGKEFYLQDHGNMLPAAVYPEMVLKASGVSGLKNMVWHRPLVISGTGTTVRTILDGDTCKISTENQDSVTVHCQCILHRQPAPQPPDRDVQTIESRCSTVLEKQECHRLLEGSHGPTLMSIETLKYNGREALASLVLPASLADGQDYILHPSLLNGAILSSVILARLQNENKDHRLSMPFALEALHVHGPLPQQVLVHAREQQPGQRPAKGAKHDIDLMNRQGQVLVSLKGLATVPMDAEPSPQKSKASLVFAAPQWTSRPITASEPAKHPAPVFVLTREAAPSIEQALRGQWPTARVESLPHPDSDIEENFLCLFRLIKANLEHRAPMVLLIPESAETYLFAPLTGLLKTLGLEHPQIEVKSIRYASTDRLFQLLEAELGQTGAVEIRYTRDGSRQSREMAELTQTPQSPMPLARPGDVIWITGGLGGLGRIFARGFGRAKGVKLILSSPSALDPARESRLEELRQQGIDAQYHCSDAGDIAQAQALVRTILAKHGKLTGILHTAGVIRDAYLADKTEAQIRAVLHPKIAGILAIDQATQNLELDWLVLCSSLAGTHGNPGQGDYAGANAFLDAFARRRNQWKEQGLRHGRTLCVNWPLWADGGMQLDPRHITLMQHNTGMVPMTSQAGIQALDQAFALGHPQILVAQGDPDKIRASLFSKKGPEPEAIPVPKQKIEDQLIGFVAEIQEIDPKAINPDVELSEYGFDSIDFTEFTNRLNLFYGLELMPTVFFEYTTVSALGTYLAQLVPQPPEPGPEPEPEPTPPPKPRSRPAPKNSEAIAVIGMSGRFPGSAHLNQFWDNLVHNRDLITEIPQDRWDWRHYYGEPGAGNRKTKIKWGGFIDHADCFDPLFFGISPLEAEAMDPQFRLLLETVWAAIEDAGYAPGTLAGTKTGVFAGASTLDYRDLWQRAGQKVCIPESTGPYAFAIANRISYIFDFHGPSEIVDTACSSSLTAIHRAVESLKQGSCDMALAGGVNLIANPDLTISFSQSGILSNDGRCKSFDARADGYVRSEGVGVVLLKPLARAIADNDRIDALIRGTATNHGGRSASPTAPNPLAQQALLFDAYQKADIDPCTVTYIEAHGTGTKLGDPIEIQGLKDAFHDLYQARGITAPRTPHCAIGTVKANIGHLEAAAGISGFIKTVLMLKHRKIPGNPHLETINPYLKLTDSPFYLAKETRDWQTDGPIIAGISSFGVGGANAHIIVEQYIPPARLEPASPPAKDQFIILSAKNRDRLRQMAVNLHRFLKSGYQGRATLADIAYTLRAGRDLMPERIGFTAKTQAELMDKLQAFLDGTLGAGLNGTDLDGLDVDGPGTGMGARRVSLPTYPFARERYWAFGPARHPLLHRNESDDTGQLFSTTFTGKEFFLADHKVKGQAILPGVAYLEMARAAAGQMAGNKGDDRGLRLGNVVWARPFAPDPAGDALHIRLTGEENQRISFQIFSTPDKIHSQGLIQYKDETEIPRLDLNELRQRINQGRLEGRECYQALRDAGVSHGPSLQGVQTICYAKFNPSPQVLAQISLPACLGDDPETGRFVLHPSLMDAALQATVGMAAATHGSLGGRAGQKPALPFALESLDILGPCTADMWVWIRESGQNGKTIQKLDLDLCDDTGIVCVRMKGFSSRILENRPQAKLTLMAPVWDVVTPAPHAPARPSSEERTLVTGAGPDLGRAVGQCLPNSVVLDIHPKDSIAEISRKFKESGPIDHLVWVAPDLNCRDKNPWDEQLSRMIEAQEAGVIQVFRIIKALLELDYAYQDLAWTVLTRQTRAVRKKESAHPAHAAVHGLMGSLAKEYPHWKIRLLDLESAIGLDLEAVGDLPVQKIFTMPFDSQGDALFYRNKEWFKQSIIPIEPGPAGSTPCRHQGVYVVIGGAGGIGSAWSRHMMQTYGARIVWLGRRPLDNTIQARLDALQGDPAPVYIQADAGNLHSLEKARQQIKQRFGRIDGLVHSAISLLDQSLNNMNEERFRAGLSAKADVCVRLAEVFGRDDPDLVLFFSSMQSFGKMAGQSNYAAGCVFKDAFARQLARAWGAKGGGPVVKIMNWGYWGSVGVVTDAAYRDRMEQAGVGSIEPAEGMAALDVLLQGPMDQLGLVKMVEAHRKPTHTEPAMEQK